MAKEPSKLEERILEDGRKRADPIKRRARRKADRIVEGAREEAQKRREQMRQEAEQEAEQQAHRILARAELEAENVRRLAREQVLQKARQIAWEKLERIGDSRDHIECLARLALRSLQAMRGNQFELLLRDGDKAQRGERILDAVKDRAGEELDRDVDIRLADETLSRAGGLIVSRADGKELCDQTFAARMERFWPQIRTEIADALLQSAQRKSR